SEQKNQAKAALYLLQAEASGGPSEHKKVTPNLDAIKESVGAASKNLRDSKVLWVDDNSQGQTYERQALEQLGVEFVLAKNTEQALEILKDQQFQAVITDFKRSEDSTAGYTLLKKIQQEKIDAPVIIYSGSATPEFVAEAKSFGAYGETNRPQELFDMVVNAVKK
ncbi:response regulator, partial [Methylophilus sp.]